MLAVLIVARAKMNMGSWSLGIGLCVLSDSRAPAPYSPTARYHTYRGTMQLLFYRHQSV